MRPGRCHAPQRTVVAAQVYLVPAAISKTRSPSDSKPAREPGQAERGQAEPGRGPATDRLASDCAAMCHAAQRRAANTRSDGVPRYSYRPDTGAFA